MNTHFGLMADDQAESIFAGMRRDQHCTGAFALDEAGVEVDPKSEDARQWSAVGWLRLHKVPRSAQVNDSYCKAGGTARILGFNNIETANDALGWAFIEALKEYEKRRGRY